MLKNSVVLVFLLVFIGINHCLAETMIDLKVVSFKNPEMPYERIITGGQPSKEDLVLLKQFGVKNVINLRTQGEFDGFDQAKLVDDLGLKYQTLEVAGASGITVENAQKLNQLLVGMEGTTFVHCASSNRVGALFAVIANQIHGKSIDQALQEGKKAGMKSLTDKTNSLLQELAKGTE